VDCSEDLGTVVGDATKVRQATLNLLSNAAKFTENGTISLAARRDKSPAGDWISLAVSDTGIGIAAEDLPKLFKDFVQASAFTSSKYGGSGLGLALSQKFCAMMGGGISVESEPGRGSRFTIRIPAMLTIPDIHELSVGLQASAA
jgi:signal transduction histidine kinase